MHLVCSVDYIRGSKPRVMSVVCKLQKKLNFIVSSFFKVIMSMNNDFISKGKIMIGNVLSCEPVVIRLQNDIIDSINDN